MNQRTPPKQFDKAMVALGTNLASLRKKKGWTADEAATKLNLSKGYLYMIEQGHPPSLRRLLYLKRAYECKWLDIFRGVR